LLDGESREGAHLVGFAAFERTRRLLNISDLGIVLPVGHDEAHFFVKAAAHRHELILARNIHINLSSILCERGVELEH